MRKYKLTEKEQMESKKRREKGITLIALIVTIVILLILAGIGIGTLSGDNGLINQTRRSKTWIRKK